MAAAKRGKVGRPPKVKGQTNAKGNVNDKPFESKGFMPYESTGTSQYAYQKLRDDAPELHSKVLAGQLSPHAAMVKAGFRKKRVAVSMSDAQSAYNTLTKNMSDEVLSNLLLGLLLVTMNILNRCIL